MRPDVLPAAISNIGRQKSVPTTPAPVISNSVSDKSPVPHATSRTRELLDESLSRTLSATIRRQRLSVLPESKWFKRSYRPAIVPNISRTRPACSLAAIPLPSTVSEAKSDSGLVARRLQSICDYPGLLLFAGFVGGFCDGAGVAISPSTSYW